MHVASHSKLPINDLVTPSSHTEGGHRLYDDDDVMRLEQVLALKFMGFSLPQVKDILEQAPSTWEQSLEQQLHMIEQQQKQLEALEKAVRSVLYSIRLEGKVKWPVIFHLIQMFRRDADTVDELFEDYFSLEELEKNLN